MPVSRRSFLLTLAAAPLAARAGLAGAQEAYPSRALRLVVPYPPGGLTDVLGRAMAERLSKALGQPVVVENKPGAATLIGADMVAKSPADGYTLLLATSTTFGIAPAVYARVPIDPVRDFQHVSLIGTVNFFLIGSRKFPAKTLGDVIALIKANPGKFNYASVGNGSAHHLYMEDLKKRLGLDIQHVPYKGTQAALLDLIPGKVQIMFCDAAVAVGQIKSGKVNVYGTSAAKQNTLLPQVAPIASTVPGFDWQAWQGISVPAATPAPVVARLSSEMQKFQNTPEFHKFLARIGMEPWAPNTPADYARLVKNDMGRWADAVRAAGARIE
ncbi:MAG TPA: tripartite tricarboxylate transporter substrate binding protein [Burkholderiales bacterium]|nr:tripartite tricarboxylate transporter substrate binding protein [Burkholderiales bacterium]